MTPEELNRTIEFIVASQARLAAAQEQDRHDRVQFEEWSKGLLAKIAETDARLEQNQARLEQRNARLEQSHAGLAQTHAHLEQNDRRYAALFVQLTELSNHQSQRMDRIDKFYEDWLRQNGDFQQQVLDLHRQELRLLNLILDRLPPAWPNPN
jgi:chromosome segregation ATPase